MAKSKTIALFFLALLVAVPAFAQNVGEPAPNFNFRDLDNNEVQLSDYPGKVVGLYLFGYGCPFCISAAPTLHTEVYDVFKDDPDFVMLGLDTWDGSTQQVVNFKNTTGAVYPLLQKAGSYESTARTTYDRFLVVGKDGNMSFKGSTRIGNQIDQIKAAVTLALAVQSTASEEEFPFQVKLHQNYPNPFNPSTQITFDLAQTDEVQLKVFSSLGKEVATLVNGQIQAGSHSVEFNMASLPSGLYIYRLQAGGEVLSRVMTLLR